MATEPDLVHCIYASSATRPFSFDQLVELLAVARRESDMWAPVVQASGFTPAD